MTTPSKTIEETFKKTNLRDHILDLPDTYIGRTQIDEISLFVFDEETEKIKEEIIKFSQGKYKIFDEIITNARDSSVRDKSCKNISVNLDRKTGYITVWNDGSGIPVCIHKDHNIYVPELIFGNLLTSQNYNQKASCSNLPAKFSFSKFQFIFSEKKLFIPLFATLFTIHCLLFLAIYLIFTFNLT
jgi:DNA topoisomerase-2